MIRKKSLMFVAIFASLILFPLASSLTESVGLDDYVVDFEYDEEDVEAGETFRLEVTVTNEAGEDRDDIFIAIDFDDPFDEVGDDEKRIGFLRDGESRTTSFRLEVDKGTEDGDYDLDFEIRDSVSEDREEVNIEVNSDGVDLIISEIRSVPTIIAPDTQDIRLTLFVENTGEGRAESVRARLILPEGFSPSGSYTDRVNLGNIFEGSQDSAEFFIDTSAFVESGNHEAFLELDYEDEDDEEFSKRLPVDLPVKGRPQFLVSLVESDPSPLTAGSEGMFIISVNNIGDEEGKETTIRVFENADQPFDFNEKTNYIGDLLPGQSGTGSISFEIESDAVEKDYFLRVQTRTISEGNVLVEEYTIPVEVREQEERNPMVYFAAVPVLLFLVLVYLIAKPRKKRD